MRLSCFPFALEPGGGCCYQGCRQIVVPDDDLRQRLHRIREFHQVVGSLSVIACLLFHILRHCFDTFCFGVNFVSLLF